MKRTLIASGLLCLLLGVPGAASAATLTWEFTSTVNATEAGGSAVAPFFFRFTFDTNLANDSGGTVGGCCADVGSYGPISGVIGVDGQEVSFASGFFGSGFGTSELTVVKFDDDDVDRFDIRAREDALVGLQLFGRDIGQVVIQMQDDDGTMFSDTSLPTTTAFSADVDRVFIGVDLLGDFFSEPILFAAFLHETPQQTPPFTLLEVIPVPAALPLLLTGLVGLGLIGWRKRQRVLASKR